ncbi:ornithine decarboxylase [Neobacillus massiliamazoniensis]|uniref:ornithine decarboxylase n=1 Tax=Neobacillus massiliamazoniensis TaxID=1499688 RepID=A0A0U1NRL8_9BACI|nr:ornithine decarboxylase [Neobacillus massiliamazoniensis]CRK80398.1 Orn/Lys/Arg decarboxylase major region [Neobacillus massiliamazoniensis]
MSFKLAIAPEAAEFIHVSKRMVDATKVHDWTDISALVVMDSQLEIAKEAEETKFGIPCFVVTDDASKFDMNQIDYVDHLIDSHNSFDKNLYSREVEHASKEYEERAIPPFFKGLQEAVGRGSLQFETPGHQGGQYFRKHPAGRQFYDFFGENIFRADFACSEVALGDLLIHEGPAMEAEKHAAKVFNADKTYFVMNGSTTSNNITISAAISHDDLVLFDRNNHKSVYNSALIMNGGRPVYLETNRDSYGFIGGIYDSNFEEEYIREQVRKIDPERAEWKRPFRLAVIQLGTYDGNIYNAKQVIERIGHLCDYILFDSAWVGYEQFIPMMKSSSPLLVDLGPEAPGIFVVQSTHKGQAGFSQASQIHKKDKHIKGQDRYIDHKRMNNSYMKYSSTSPFYPLFASLDVNAQMQEGEVGKKLWEDLMVILVDARKELLEKAKMIRPFLPPIVHGKAWQEAPSEEIAKDVDYWRFNPEENWHGFDGYSKNQYFVDPNKFLLTTPGINTETDSYEDFGIPAIILANYLREHGIIPEKSDLNAIEFLMTPAEDTTKIGNLITQILKFEKLVEADAPLAKVLPRLYETHQARYEGYTVRKLAQEMHDFYKDRNCKDYQKKMFKHEYLPEQAMTPFAANEELKRNNTKLVPISKIQGEIALEGALPYPPGILCVVPGEVWNDAVCQYFLILEEGINRFPGFAPEIQGVYFSEENGRIIASGYVFDAVKKEQREIEKRR